MDESVSPPQIADRNQNGEGRSSSDPEVGSASDRRGTASRDDVGESESESFPPGGSASTPHLMPLSQNRVKFVAPPIASHVRQMKEGQTAPMSRKTNSSPESRDLSGGAKEPASGDEILDHLLAEGVITATQVDNSRRPARPSEALWRVIAGEAGVDDEVVYRVVAELRGYVNAAEAVREADPDAVRSTLEGLPPTQRERLWSLGIVPLPRATPDAPWRLVTHDPSRAEVQEHVRPGEREQIELQFAPRGLVRELLRTAIPEEGDGAVARPGSPGDDDPTLSTGTANKEPEVETQNRVVQALLRREQVPPSLVQKAQRKKQNENTDETLWRILARIDGVDSSVVYERASRIYAFPRADLDEHPPDPEYAREVMDRRWDEDTKERLLELGIVPHRTSGGTLHLITHDPMRPEVHRTVRALGLDDFELQYVPETTVNQLISDAFPRDNEYLQRLDEESALDLGQNFEDEDDLVDDEKLEEEINRSTLINLFEATLVEAVRDGASDIHLYPNAEKEVEIHFRNDGRLSHWHTEDRVHPEALLSVVKDNSMGVDRFERDTAQDGFIQRDVDGTRIRFRVSIMPIASSSQDINAESVVIRVLDDRKVITDLEKLGLGPRALDQFEHAINQPHGMVILTGPTGSGKSTTLVAALHSVIGPSENVLTIEDPVEYIIEGARQIKLSDKLELTDALRSILRHDPDTVMVGEMRDKVTAELAIKLANTGHLTFSTLHTNDAPSAVSRLYKMGIEPFLIAYAINLVVAQRLIRTLCPACKAEDPDPDPVMLKQLGFPEEEIGEGAFYTTGQTKTCQRCGGTGYDGRRAIAEALHLSREIRHMIVESEGMIDEGAIRDHAESEDGMRSLQASARQVVLEGKTSVQEMMRVVAS